MMRFFFPSVAAVFLLLAGCATQGQGPVTITKVNPYHLTSAQISDTPDEMIAFEQRRFLRGAVTSEDYQQRYGNYYSVFWRSETKAPATVRLDYRLGSTGAMVHRKEVQVSNPKANNVTDFQITGEEYQTKGKVTQWKVSILEQGNVVAEYRSFLWK